jgi:hypothetical protein
MVIPIRILWNLKISLIEKISISVIFVFGIITIVTAIVRVVSLESDSDDHQISTTWLILVCISSVVRYGFGASQIPCSTLYTDDGLLKGKSGCRIFNSPLHRTKVQLRLTLYLVVERRRRSRRYVQICSPSFPWLQKIKKYTYHLVAVIVGCLPSFAIFIRGRVVASRAKQIGGSTLNASIFQSSGARSGPRTGGVSLQEGRWPIAIAGCSK